MKTSSKKPRKKQPLELISLAELARRKGVARSTATRAARGPLSAAMVAHEIDATHPDVVKWLGPAARRPTLAPAKSTSGAVPTRDQFTRVAYRKRKAEARRLELMNAEKEGHLVSREAVATHLVGMMHSTFSRLLRDLPRTTVARLTPMVIRGEPSEDCERVTRELLSSILTPATAAAAKSLRALASQKAAQPEANTP